MIPTTGDKRLRGFAAARARSAGAPAAHWSIHGEWKEQSPARLRPGAAIMFAIAAVMAVLSFIEVLFS